MFGIDAPPKSKIPGYILPLLIAVVMVSTYSLIKKQKNKLK